MTARAAEGVERGMDCDVCETGSCECSYFAAWAWSSGLSQKQPARYLTPKAVMEGCRRAIMQDTAFSLRPEGYGLQVTGYDLVHSLRINRQFILAHLDVGVMKRSLLKNPSLNFRFTKSVRKKDGQFTTNDAQSFNRNFPYR
jgi:hypothetical protein